MLQSPRSRGNVNLATLDGFFSTVVDLQKPGWVLIRVRCENDIKNLFTRHREACPSVH